MTTVCALKYMLENDTTIKEAAEEFDMNDRTLCTRLNRWVKVNDPNFYDLVRAFISTRRGAHISRGKRRNSK